MTWYKIKTSQRKFIQNEIQERGHNVPQPSPIPSNKTLNDKINNKRQINKSFCCPFACHNCQSLGGDLVKSKYEIIDILSNIGDNL